PGRSSRCSGGLSDCPVSFNVNDVRIVVAVRDGRELIVVRNCGRNGLNRTEVRPVEPLGQESGCRARSDILIEDSNFTGTITGDEYRSILVGRLEEWATGIASAH